MVLTRKKAEEGQVSVASYGHVLRCAWQNQGLGQPPARSWTGAMM